MLVPLTANVACSGVTSSRSISSSLSNTASPFALWAVTTRRMPPVGALSGAGIVI